MGTLEAAVGIEPTNKGFADLCLTTWLRRPKLSRQAEEGRKPRFAPFYGNLWSGRRDSNPRLRPWQGRTLPLSYSRSARYQFYSSANLCQALFAPPFLLSCLSKAHRMLPRLFEQLFNDFELCILAALAGNGSACVDTPTAERRVGF